MNLNQILIIINHLWKLHCAKYGQMLQNTDQFYCVIEFNDSKWFRQFYFRFLEWCIFPFTTTKPYPAWSFDLLLLLTARIIGLSQRLGVMHLIGCLTFMLITPPPHHRYNR